jgi:GTP diphosphokinase / guanosine-3',5'-bis(diphosphate) 3'-diphosphatase
MMRQYELVERVTAYDADADEDLLNRAYVYAMKAHGNQTRASGEAYFNHPLEVAAILAEMRLDSATIAAALLHDTVEDTEATHQEIIEKFGPEIAELVDGLTKIKQLDRVTREATQAENLRKLLLAMAKDVRVLLVKLADRLHNMRTLEHVKPEKRLRVAEETMDIYAPLAGRMGMQLIRDELEDLAFEIINPQAAVIIRERLERLHEESGDVLSEIETSLETLFKEKGLKADVVGREKRPYSIWRKMERKHLALNQLSDIFAFRVIVEKMEDCYRALGQVHQRWRAVPDRFKDYISNPKQNDYRSLHTTVIGPHHMRVEMQIRTRIMHEIAERGVAAHALYKESSSAEMDEQGMREGAAESNAYRWLRHLMEVLQEGDSPKEFLEHTRLELFQDQVFCFTPKGQLIALPRGATAIDFAYAVHTSVGDSCIGCKINGRQSPLVTQLNNGDEVSIMRSEAQTPPPAWEAIVVTGKAKAAIRRATRAAVRKQFSGLGRDMVLRLLARHKLELDEKALTKSVSRLGHKNVDDALTAVGKGELAAPDVLKAMGIAVDESDVKAAKRRLSATKSSKKAGADAIPVRGAQAGSALKFHLKTGAVPGERIVGIVMPGDGISIYPIFAKELEQFDDQPDRWVDLAWGPAEEGQRFPARIQLNIVNEVGALAQVTQSIGENGGNIDELHLSKLEGVGDSFGLDVLLEVFDIRHLNDIIAAIKARSSVTSVVRATG